jgi:hypothetical protein
MSMVIIVFRLRPVVPDTILWELFELIFDSGQTLSFIGQ